MKTAKELHLPLELVKDKETIDMLIEFLSIHRRIIEGKTVSSKQGIRNKFKFYFLHYPLVERTYLCEKCKTPMVLEKTDDLGTEVKFSTVGSQIIRDAKMPFKWLYFTCPKCGWGRVTTDQ